MSNCQNKNSKNLVDKIKPHVMNVDDLDSFSQAVIGLVERRSRFDLKKMEAIKEFWVMYDSIKHPLKRSPFIFAAALDYVFSGEPAFGGSDEVTKVGMARRYGGDRKAIARKITEFKGVLPESFALDHEEEEHEFDHPPVVVLTEEERFDYEKRELMAGRVVESDAIHELDEITEADEIEWHEAIENSPFISCIPRTKEQRAQALVYQSMDFLVHEEILNYKEALEWDPCNSDAYTLLGNYQREPHHKEAYYQKAISCAEDRLGKEFIQEHRGQLWNHLDGRPYLRAKAALAYLRDIKHQDEEAIDRYEELLQLNQEDDQGIRDHLIRLYLERGQYQDAKRIREAYQYDEYMEMLYNDILISIGLNHSNETINDKVEKAQKSNLFVIVLLTDNDCDVETLENLGLQIEAMHYLDENIHLWKGKEDYLKGI